ncbi:MAG TPA: methyl-accepting chemotaxis protein, partial [Acidimicrobiia bacterium]
MLGRLRIRTKLAVLVAVPLVALVATGVLGWTTLQNTKVLGPRYDNIKTSQGLIADVMPPPDNVQESYLVAYQA